jgi:2Fe-2S ferredoxin
VPQVHYTQPDGTVRVVAGAVGDSVMQTAVRNGVSGIVAQCGGSLSCATCHVFVAEDDLAHFGDVSEDEDEMLDCAATDREKHSRLSCQLVLTDGRDVHVSIPAAQL